MDSFSAWPPAAKALAGLFALALVAVLWSVVASVVFLAGEHLIGRDTVPLWQFWQYQHYYGFHHPIVGRWLQIAAAVATAIPVLLILARLMRGGGLPKGKELHGSTRWANSAEMKREGFYTPFGGLYVGQDARGRYLRWGGPEHVACYAPTRSGKGVGLVIPNCLLYEASLVCLDVKKENWAATAGIRQAAGQAVHLFDPLAPDGRTARYNPLSYVRRGTVDAFEDIQRIAQMVFPHSEGPQQFWDDSARSAFTGAAAFLTETPELPLTFGEVLRLLSSSSGAAATLNRIEARRQAGKPYTEATVKALEDYLKGSDDLVNSIRKTVTAKLSLWFNPRIDTATSASDFDLRELRNHLHAIYIGVTPDNIARLRPLLALFFQQLVDLTVRTLPQHDPNAKHQVLVLLDEFPLLGPMPVLADAFAFVAGYNMRLMLIMQSKAQLRDRALYGPDKAEAILDNCGLEVVFGTKDLKLTEELSARLGYDTVEAVSRSGPRFWAWFRRDRLNTTATDQRRALLLPQEIARLASTEAILVRPGMFPVRAKRIRYYREKLFTRLLRPAPVVEPIDVVVRMDGGSPPAAAPAAPPPPAPPPAPTVGEAPIAGTAAPAKAKRTRRKADGEGEPARSNVAPIAPELPLTSAESPKPHQTEALLRSIGGMSVDLTNMGLDDGKALASSIIDAMPTVERLNRTRGAAA